MAHLSGGRLAAHGCSALAALLRPRSARASSIHLSEPDRAVHIRALARFLSVMRKSMESNSNSTTGILVGRILSALIVAGAIALGFVVVYHANYYPRTDDSEILANFIGIAPQVEGPLVRLNVHDNQFVKKGDLLFEMDERP